MNFQDKMVVLALLLFGVAVCLYACCLVVHGKHWRVAHLAFLGGMALIVASGWLVR
jgi:hypothetical protein